MAGNLLSRLIPGKDGSAYNQLREEGDVDIENRAALALDEENLTHQFHDDDLENADGIEDSQLSSGSAALTPRDVGRGAGRRTGPDKARTRWPSQDDDGDNEVPASLLVEAGMNMARAKSNARRSGPQPASRKAVDDAPGPGPSSRRRQAQWEAAQAQQRLHPDDDYGPAPHGLASRLPMRVGLNGNAKEKALFRWANVSNLDGFIGDVYHYYLGAGIWCMLLERVLHILKAVFIACLLTLLTQCIKYGRIRESKSLAQIMIPKCTKNMWGIWNVGLWLTSFYIIWKSIHFFVDAPRLLHIRDFYTYLLEIPDEDMQTVSWQDVVSKITALRDHNVKTASNITPSQRRYLSRQLGQHVSGHAKERLDAHDIANRLMRRENYIIALFNKDVLDLSAPLPFLRNRQFFSRTLLWTLQFSILDMVFNDQNQVRQQILKSDRRAYFTRELKMRFAFAATMNLIFAPFVAAFLVIDFIFTYYNEFKTNTSAVGAKQYTPLAEWKFREFNELPHFYKERLNMSYPYAKHYMDQFPKLKTESVARTVRFFTGALIAVLAIVGFSDPEMFVDFEILPRMNALAFLAICTTTWAVAHGMISEENNVFDPEFALRNVIEFTHYEPDQWKGRLHSYDVKLEFADLYKMKVLIFLEEILGILVTPLILFLSLPKCADQIIDFFREFTIHVDGLGYVCSFAVFNLQKDPRRQQAQQQHQHQQRQQQQQQGSSNDAREDYYATKHGKMQASVYGFLDNYVYNPRSGLPGNNPLGPGGRHQFHPPPAFPGLNSPTLAAEMRASRVGRHDRAPSRAPVGKMPRFGSSMPQPSPMASMLLDPHNQPSASFLAPRGKGRQQRSVYQAEDSIIEESGEDANAAPNLGRPGTAYTEEDVEESVAHLGESRWEESPNRGRSRRDSTVGNDEDDGPGVVKLLKQFQQAMDHRAGGVL